MWTQLKGRSWKQPQKPEVKPRKGYHWTKNISGHWVQRKERK